MTSNSTQPSHNTTPPENPFLNLIVNILLPVIVLNKGNKYFEPRMVLFVALCFPLVYGLQDYIRRRHKNYVSLIGIVNIMLTGSLAVLHLHGKWFAVKDASLPLLLGVLVLGSAWTKNPAAALFFCNPNVLNMGLIEDRLAAFNRKAEFQALLKQTTLWLSLSFFLSSICNFFLALHVFEEIDPSLSSADQSQILNSQIARMTWMGFGMIALPLMVFSGTLIYRFLNKVAKLTDIAVDSLLKS